MSAARSTSSAGRFAKTATSRRTTAAGAGADPVKAPSKIGRTAERTEKFRTTVDLDPADHRRLRRIANRLAEDLDVAEVPRRAVWLALLAELDDDAALYDRVLDRIREARSEVP
ncbi:hypothetical protein ACIRPH_31575 [Nocardiopsis sp. NPDC101807]|uniref:hypothetical protein n=1 Tax=Nocardiopsis sp. NPDC101807 TaxID=3364339 RepID=UPI0037FA84BE